MNLIPRLRREIGRTGLAPTAAAMLTLAGIVLLLPAAAAAPVPPVVQTRRALDHLGQAALAWQAQFDCSGCHKQPITLTAMGTALSRGHDAPLPGVVDALLAGTLEGDSGQDANGCFSFSGSSGFTMATTFAGRGLEASDRFLRSNLGPNLQAAAGCLLARQAADGRLPADSVELPVSQGDFVTTAHAAYVWKRTFERTGTAAYDEAAGRAVAWLRGRISAIEAAPPGGFTTQDKAMLLAGLGAAGSGPMDPDVSRMHAVLAASQFGNGSWKIQNSNAGGNAYATGLAVFALRSAGFGREDPVTAAGHDWLLLNQQADGSWPANDWVGHSPSQVAPSMWAALALATFPSPLATLRVSGNTIAWDAVQGADSYDLIRGSVSNVARSGGSITLGPVTCVSSGGTGTSAGDSWVPAPGTASFYVLRIRWSGNLDSYGRSSDGFERLPAAGDCGP